MPPAFYSSKWMCAAGLVCGAATLLFFILNKQRKEKERIEERRKMLRLLIEDQLCHGRPNVKVHVIASLEDWAKVEDTFLHDVDLTKIMGLDCEWITQNDYVGKVDTFYISFIRTRLLIPFHIDFRLLFCNWDYPQVCAFSFARAKWKPFQNLLLKS